MALQQKFGMRLVNGIGRTVQTLLGRNRPFDLAGLEAIARKHTGLDDFGSARYREPLQVLCEAYAADRDLTFIGQQVCRGGLINPLENRLRIQQSLTAQPELLTTPVVRPLLVIGLPRTGTTLLFSLLAQDTTSRPLLFWESMQPAPPPTPETRTTDPRIEKARKTLKALHSTLPELSAIHHFVHDGPEECLGLLMNAFFTPFFRGRIPAYRDWLDAVSEEFVDWVYVEYRQQLQLLQSQVTGHHWLLKCPSHLWGLGGLLRAMPEAAIVQTHRHVAESLPSLCSLTATVEQLCYTTVDPQEVGQRGLHTVEQLVTRSLQARDAAPQAAIHDVGYRELIQDPVASVRSIYERFGFPFTSEFEQRMRDYLQQNRQGQHGRHRYSLEQYGLSFDLVRDRFRAYHDRFGLNDNG